MNIRCLSGQYQVFIRCFVLQDQDSQARSAALRSPAPAHAPPDYPCLLPGAASCITARRGIVGPPARSAWSASHQRPGSPWLATPSLRSGSPVSGCRTAAICSSRSSLLSKLFHADVFPNRAGKTFIKYAVAFRLSPECFYSVRFRCGVQMSLGLRAGDRASASANRYRGSFPLRVNRTPTSLALAPAGGPVGLVSSDPPICSALASVQNQPAAASARRRLSQIPRGPGRQDNNPALLSGAIPGQDHALSIAGSLSA